MDVYKNVQRKSTGRDFLETISVFFLSSISGHLLVVEKKVF